MYRYFLGAFGNYSFIGPQYEITEDGSLREMWNSRAIEFPNGGTVTLANISDREFGDIKNRLLKFRVDFDKDFRPEHDDALPNSNRYQITLDAIDDFDKDEIIEIIDINYPVEEFLNDKTKQTIRIKHKPNKQILLRYDENCYGPFEFMVSDIEDSYDYETYYTLKVFVNNGTINKYKIFDIERIIKDGRFSLRKVDSIQFIYRIEELQEIKSFEEIDYFDNEELADFFKSLLDKSNDIENLAEIREQFLHIADSFSEREQITDLKIKRICDLLQTSVELSDYKIRLTDEYFRNNPNAKADKEEYLRTHVELIDEVVRKDLQYDATVKAITVEINELRHEKDSIVAEKTEEQQKLNEQKKELEKLGEQVVAQKQQELNDLMASKQEALNKINDEIEKAKKQNERLKSDENTYRRDLESAQDDYNRLNENFRQKIIEWAADDRHTEIIKLLKTQFNIPEDSGLSEFVPHCINNLNNELDAEQIVLLLCGKLNEAGRKISKDEAYNYLISVVQNYITVFAGEPGTGKTSLCKLLAKALGLYDLRFAEVLVERGWTSSKDLIGYYNPLTKEIEKAQPQFSECMQQLNIENERNMVQALYFVLLDEANLSPIEFYWSNFNYYCDDPSHQMVSYSNGETYKFGAELKFLATINYDHTTTDLSPRFLDRAWVISMNPVSIDAIAGDLTDDTKVSNNEEVISLKNLNDIFGWKNHINKKMNQITKTRLERIVDKMKEGKHTISARSLQAINRYYFVAEEYMSSKEVALDYAISQKILPCINGNGKKYGEFLDGLMNICKENQLNRCANIISKIKEKSEHEFYSFFSL